jgi:hypothetical protein
MIPLELILSKIPKKYQQINPPRPAKGGATPQAKFSFPLRIKNRRAQKSKDVKKILLSAFCSFRAGGVSLGRGGNSPHTPLPAPPSLACLWHGFDWRRKKSEALNPLGFYTCRPKYVL